MKSVEKQVFSTDFLFFIVDKSVDSVDNLLKKVSACSQNK